MSVKNLILITFSLLFYSCENSEPLTLSDEYWEGEKILIIAQLNLNSNAEVTILNTFNPVVTPLPQKQALSDMNVFILKDGIYFDSLNFDDSQSKYFGNKLIVGGHFYQVVIPQTTDTIKSQVLFFPDVQIRLEGLSTLIDNDSIKTELKIRFINFSTGFAKVNLSFPSQVLMNSKLESFTTKYNSNCISKSEIDLKCLKDSVFCQNDFLHYFPQRYTILKTDSIFCRVEYFSPDLELLKNGNANKLIEFSTNNPFKSSFSNAYGYFGYKLSFSQSQSLLD